MRAGVQEKKTCMDVMNSSLYPIAELMGLKRGCAYRVVDVGHLQQVLGAAVLLHLNGLPAPLHGYTVTFGEVGVRGHLHVSALEDDLVDVILVFP